MLDNMNTRTQKHTSRRRALITGASSGTGAAAAFALAETHELVLVGRRSERLSEVARSVRVGGGKAETIVFDLTTGDCEKLIATAGPITDLVCAAGLNTPQRAWADQKFAEFEAIVSTNLTSVAALITSALPALRAASGSVAVVSSLSAWTLQKGAGVAYRASKSALRALTESLNEQEADHGVRASLICPGEIDSEFLALRPSVPDETRRQRMLSPQDIGDVIAYVMRAPRHLRVDEMVVSPLGTIERGLSALEVAASRS